MMLKKAGLLLAVVLGGCSGGSGGEEQIEPAGEVPLVIERIAPGTSWQIQLSGPVDTSFNVQLYDIDLFETPQSQIDELKTRGVTVICYFSAGSWESFRSDAANYPEAIKGHPLEDFPDERWLDIRAVDQLMPLISARLDLAVQKGCDGVDPDNMDGYANAAGFPLTAADQLAFNRLVAEAAHQRGLSVGLKNDLEQAAQLEPEFDWALNEQCVEYDECSLLQPFIQSGKAVFGIEYSGSAGSVCPQVNSLNYDWLLKNLSLDAARTACR